MASEENIAQLISREINPHVRVARATLNFGIVILTMLMLLFVPKTLAWYLLVILAGFNLIVLLNYAEEIASKWKNTEI